MYGTRVAVLAGDFLFAQSSWFLANLDNLEVSVDSSCMRMYCRIGCVGFRLTVIFTS